MTYRTAAAKSESAEEVARAGIAAYLSGDNSGWTLLWKASQMWREQGDESRADAAEREARRCRKYAMPSFSGGRALDLHGVVDRLGLGT